MEVLVVFEKTKTGFSAYAPDFPGCVATGDSKEKTEANMFEALEFHLEGMKADGIMMIEPTVKGYFYNLSDEGKVDYVNEAEVLYDASSFASKAGIKPATARQYAHRYKIGKKLGGQWVFTEADLAKIPKAKKEAT